MKKFKFSLSSVLVFLSAICLFVGVNAFADVVTSAPTDPDLTQSLLALWSAIQNHSGTALLLVPIFQILRTHETLGILSKLSGKWMSVIVAVLTTAGFVVNAKIAGQSLLQAAITGLVTSGGAMMIYDAFKDMNSAPVVAVAVPSATIVSAPSS